jgi:hypothetical protein
MADLARTLKQHPLKRPRMSTDFESLSPITFQGVEDLTKKLSSYKPKYTKRRTTIQDNSPANHSYFLVGEEPNLTRGAFEHGR